MEQPEPSEARRLAERLDEAAREGLGRSLEEREARGLLAYARQLLSWGERINLTGASSLEELADAHLADALMLVSHLPRRPGARLVDVGSGAGLPGLVLAIVCPALRITLLEPTGKKTSFLRSVRRNLGLDNVDCRTQRLEALLADEPSPGFDVAVSRATWPPAEWLERARPLVRPGGRILALEGRESVPLPKGARRFPYSLGARRRAVIVLEA